MPQLLLVLWVTFAATSALLLPPLQAPDEPQHVAYATFLARRGTLPNQYDPSLRVEGQGHQPPLYYAVAAAPLRLLVPDHGIDLRYRKNPRHFWNGGPLRRVPYLLPGPGGFFPDRADAWAFYGLRGLSVALGALALIYVWRAAGVLIAEPSTRALALLLPATLPQFQFLGGSINSDNLVVPLMAGFAYHLLRAWREPERLAPYLWCGLFLGLALLTKKTALFAVPGLLGLLAQRAIAVRAEAPARLRGGAAALGCAALVSGWLFARNQILYGDPLGSAMERATMPGLVHEKSLFSGYFQGRFPRSMGQSFVGVFGWMNVFLPRAVYGFYAALGGAAALGLGLRAWRQRGADPPLWIGAGFVLLALVGVIHLNLTYSQPQGRYLFPAFAFLGVLFALGLREILDRLRIGPRRVLPVLVALLVGVDLVGVWTLFDFYYRAP